MYGDRFRHRVGPEFRTQPFGEPIEVGERARAVAGRESQFHQTPNRVFAQRVELEKCLGVVDGPGIVERAPALFAEHAQV